jgi:rubrerythrin
VSYYGTPTWRGPARHEYECLSCGHFVTRGEDCPSCERDARLAKEALEAAADSDAVDSKRKV